MLVGPNGAGKSTYYERVIAPVLGAPFVNADLIARARWPRTYASKGYEAGRLAAMTRERLVAARASFVAETVFSHPSKLELIRSARAAGYIVWVSFVGVATADLTVARVGQRIREGGHPVPPEKIRSRYANLRANVLASVTRVDRMTVIDNSTQGRALRDVLLFERGERVWQAKSLPGWVRDMFADWVEPCASR